jgi:hypothetical protein
METSREFLLCRIGPGKLPRIVRKAKRRETLERWAESADYLIVE